MPLTPDETEGLDWYFRVRRGEVVCPTRDPALDGATAARKFGAARFEALYRTWQRRGIQALWTMQSPILRDQLQRGWGRVEFAELRHQYLQLTPFVGSAHPVEDGLQERRSPPVTNPLRSISFGSSWVWSGQLLPPCCISVTSGLTQSSTTGRSGRWATPRRLTTRWSSGSSISHTLAAWRHA
jgi:hypothetical protein